MKSSRSLAAFLAFVAAFVSALSAAASLEEIREKGLLRVAVYEQFPPFHAQGKGIDVDLAQALADALGVKLSLLPFPASDESVDDDLRNMVWKGHYLGYGPADVMLHVPVTRELMRSNPRVTIVGSYYTERLALAYDRARMHETGELAVFEKEPVGVETASIGSVLLLAANDGRLRSNVRHYRLPYDALADLKQGRLAAVLARRSEVEAGIAGSASLTLGDAPFPVSDRTRWPIGLAVSSANKSLAEALAQAIAKLKANGRLAQIFARNGVTWQ